MRALKGGALSIAVFLFAALTSDAKKCKVTCDRSAHTISYGVDTLTKDVVEVDVGVCQAVNGIDTVQQDCELTENTTCLKICEPRSTEMQSFSNRSGPFRVEVVKSCYSNRHHCPETSCSRKPNIVYYFPVSKFRTRIDVGKCRGSCNNSDSHKCVSVRNKAVAVDGPNGHITVDTIQECSCQSTACYRMDHFESYSVNKTINNTSRRTEKFINVGKCVGECTGIYSPEKCVPSDDDCRWKLPRRRTYCVPIRGFEVEFEDIHDTRKVQGVKECGCSTG